MNKEIVIYPTDTIWGIGASIYNESAVKKISNIKGRPSDQPQSILFTSFDLVSQYFSIFNEKNKEKVLDFFSCAHITLGIPLEFIKREIPSWIYCDSDLVGVRLIVSEKLQKITDYLGSPFTTTSFNKSGYAPTTSREEVATLREELNLENTTKFFDLDFPMSGQASTFIRLDEKGKYTIMREGEFSYKLKKYERLFST